MKSYGFIKSYGLVKTYDLIKNSGFVNAYKLEEKYKVLKSHEVRPACDSIRNQKVLTKECTRKTYIIEEKLQESLNSTCFTRNQAKDWYKSKTKRNVTYKN